MLKAARIAAWLLVATIVVLSLVPPELRPETHLPHDLEHFAIFAATGVAFCLGYFRRIGLLTTAMGIFVGAIEIAQLFVPGRHARLSDFMVDASASCFGLLAASFVPMRKFEASRRPNPAASTPRDPSP